MTEAIKSDPQMETVINAIINQAVNSAIKELKRSSMVKEGKTPYQKVEYLLYNHIKFKEVIDKRESALNDNSEDAFWPQGKSADIIRYSKQGSGSREIDQIIAENKKACEMSLFRTKRSVKLIDDALMAITKDKYYEIIPLWYFQEKNREEIAEYFGVDVKTITRNKNILINKLSIDLFPDEVIEDELLMIT